jgi:hypothetical protein
MKGGTRRVEKFLEAIGNIFAKAFDQFTASGLGKPEQPSRSMNKPAQSLACVIEQSLANRNRV